MVSILNPAEAAVLLGVNADACTADQVRKAFRTAAKDAHPDVQQGDDGELMILLGQARDVLLAHVERREHAHAVHTSQDYVRRRVSDLFNNLDPQAMADAMHQAWNDAGSRHMGHATCPICGLVITDPGGLDAHLEVVHRDTFVDCPVCDMPVLQSALAWHLRDAHKGQDFAEVRRKMREKRRADARRNRFDDVVVLVTATGVALANIPDGMAVAVDFDAGTATVYDQAGAMLVDFDGTKRYEEGPPRG